MTLLILYRISGRLGFSKITSITSTFILATSPLFLHLSGSIMQETTMIFFSCFSIYLLINYLNKEKELYLFLSSITISLSAFAKWPGIFTLIPFFLILFRREKLGIFKKPVFYFLGGLPIILSVGWLMYIKSISVVAPGGKLFVRLFFNLDISIPLLLAHTIHKWALVLPATTIFLAITGLYKIKISEEKYFLLISWLFSGFLFYLIFLHGSVYHDHYAALMLPPISILAGLSVERISSKIPKPKLGSFRLNKKKVSGIIIITLSLSTILFVVFNPLAFTVSVENPEHFRRESKDIQRVGNYLEQIRSEGDNVALGRRAQFVFYKTSIDIDHIVLIGEPVTAEKLRSLNINPQRIDRLNHFRTFKHISS